jgi:hypothetical protein
MQADGDNMNVESDGILGRYFSFYRDTGAGEVTERTMVVRFTEIRLNGIIPMTPVV